MGQNDSREDLNVNMKRIALAALIGVGLLGVGFWFGSASASTNEPGSAGDPLVSKSYVDSLLVFQVVTVPKDSTLVGEGGTEIVLRGGQATAVASANGGILDVSDGVDVANGVVIKPNHLLVVPRTDGRGVLAKTDLILMVKGPFSIKGTKQQ